VANTCGGDVVAVAGTSTISLAGGTAGGTATCALSVRVNGPTPGVFNNVSSDLTSSAGASPGAVDTLTVVGCPAANGANFTLKNIVVEGAETYVACNTIKVDKDVQVLGPAGVLTLKAGVSVVFVKELEILSGGEMTVEIDPSLIP
jgi:hypothetical protein